MTLSNEEADCAQLWARRTEKQRERDLRFRALRDIAELKEESPVKGLFVDEKTPISLFMQSEKELEELDRLLRDAGCG